MTTGLPEFLIACTMPRDDLLAYPDALRPHVRTVLRALAQHGLMSSAHAVLVGADLPAGLGEQLRAHAKLAAVRHARACFELASLGHRLDAAGVAWAALKGPVLAELDYPRPELRDYADLDVLVDRTAFARVVELLTATGGCVVEQDWREVLQLMKGELNITNPLITIDLHWSLLYDQTLRHAFSWDDSVHLASRVTVDLGNGLVVPVLSPTSAMLHLTVHAALAGGQRLSWMRDIALASRRPGIDWDTFQGLAIGQGVGLCVGAMLRRVRRTLDAGTWPADLEADLLGQSRWGDALDAWDRLHAPPKWSGGSFSGHLLMGSTRRDGRASVRALADRVAAEVGVVRSDAGHPWHRHVPRSLRLPNGACRSATPPWSHSDYRQQFLRAVSG